MRVLSSVRVNVPVSARAEAGTMLRIREHTYLLRISSNTNEAKTGNMFSVAKRMWECGKYGSAYFREYELSCKCGCGCWWAYGRKCGQECGWQCDEECEIERVCFRRCECGCEYGYKTEKQC